MRYKWQSGARVVCSCRSARIKVAIRVWFLVKIIMSFFKKKLYIPSNSMNIRFRSFWEIKVNYIGNILEVHTSWHSILFIFSSKETTKQSIQCPNAIFNRLVLSSNIWRHGLRHIMWVFQCGCKHSLFRRFKCIYWNGKISTSAIQLTIKLFFHW